MEGTHSARRESVAMEDTQEAPTHPKLEASVEVEEEKLVSVENAEIERNLVGSEVKATELENVVGSEVKAMEIENVAGSDMKAMEGTNEEIESRMVANLSSWLCRCRCRNRLLTSLLMHMVEFFLNRPLIHYWTFFTVATLAIAEYVNKLTRIDVNYFLHGGSGFTWHQIVRICCCKCAVIDDGTSKFDPVPK